MRVLITGASGQIGTNLALRCLAEGHGVVGVDCRENSWTDAFASVLHDLRSALPAADPHGSGRPDVVVHLAAHAKVHALVAEPRLALENIAIAHTVLEYCRELRVPIVFASSREVYGAQSDGSVREDAADFTAAASPYAASKVAGEALVHAYARCYGVPFLVVRLSNVYGRYDDDLGRMERVVPLYVQRIAAGLPVTVYGEEKLLDFTYVDDCVDGIVRGIERLHDGRLRHATVNLASGTGTSLVGLAACIGDALGARPQVVIAPPRVGEVIRYVASLDRARALLDYAPKVALGEGIRRAVAWRGTRAAAPAGMR